VPQGEALCIFHQSLAHTQCAAMHRCAGAEDRLRTFGWWVWLQLAGSLKEGHEQAAV
jgi:hypothetical protein